MSTTAKGSSPKAPGSRKGNKVEMVRTTVLVPRTLNENWEVLAVIRKKGKNDIVVDALENFIDGAGMKSDKSPKLQVTY